MQHDPFPAICPFLIFYTGRKSRWNIFLGEYVGTPKSAFRTFSFSLERFNEIRLLVDVLSLLRRREKSETWNSIPILQAFTTLDFSFTVDRWWRLKGVRLWSPCCVCLKCVKGRWRETRRKKRGFTRRISILIGRHKNEVPKSLQSHFSPQYEYTFVSQHSALSSSLSCCTYRSSSIPAIRCRLTHARKIDEINLSAQNKSNFLIANRGDKNFGVEAKFSRKKKSFDWFFTASLTRERLC